MEWVLLLLGIAWYFRWTWITKKMLMGLGDFQEEMNSRFSAVDAELEEIRQRIIDIQKLGQ